MKHLRTWIEIDRKAAEKNYKTFRRVIGVKTKLFGVVKSNAYGHGLVAFSKLLNGFGVDGLCVDSLVEGLRLRKEGIKKTILVMGPTLPALYKEAATKNITVSVSNFESLQALAKIKKSPAFHIKVDTGMHRQGFYPSDIPKVLKFLGQRSIVKGQLSGLYTHFASAKDINYPTYTERQYAAFQSVAAQFANAGYANLTRHMSATGGTLLDPKYHADAVRVGIGLYGLWPSKELEIQKGHELALHPVLSWRSLIAEKKELKKGDYVGYDLAERVTRPTTMAVIPVGYWHGVPRSLSGVGEVLVGGRHARILGRVSMDLAVIDVTGIRCKTGGAVTLIGRDGKDELSADNQARRAGIIHYELVTRLNPLIERIVV